MFLVLSLALRLPALLGSSFLLVHPEFGSLLDGLDRFELKRLDMDSTFPA